MEVDRRHNLQDDCRSFGSNFHPSSQSRKISIGITLDSLGKKRSETTKKDETILSNAERTNCNKERPIEGNMKGKGAAEANEGKQTEAPEKVTSPWISTRSFNQKPSTPETFIFGRQTFSLPAARGKRSKPNRAENTTIAHSVQLFENQKSVLHSGDANQKNFKGITYKRKGSKDGNSQKAEEVIHATAKEVPESDNAAADNKREDGKTENLRMKLWEILGSVTSPRSQPSNFQAREAVSKTNLKPEQKHHQNEIPKPLQNSDTIETDSEKPDHTIKRPVTRSMNRNRVTCKRKPVKNKKDPSPSYRNTLQEQKIFSFEDEMFGKGDVAVSGGSSMSARKKGKSNRKISGIEPRRIHFSKTKNADENQRGNGRNELPPAAEKVSSHSDKRGNFHGCSPQSKGEYLGQNNGNRQGDSHQSPTRSYHHSAENDRVKQQGDVSKQAVPENEDLEEALGQPSLRDFLNQHEFQSPTFKMNTPMLSSSPSLTPKTDQIEKNIDSKVPVDRTFTLNKICSFMNLKILKTSKADCPAPNAKNESSDDELEFEESPACKPSPPNERKEVQDGLSGSSSSGDEDSTSSEEDDMDRDAFSPETATAERSNFILYPSKRLRNLEGKSVSRFSPILPSTKGVDESDWNPEPSEQNQENDLERVMTLFALALEHFKNKMKTATRKKSSDILISVSEEIHLQMQNAASKVQRDVGELTNLCKSKRKQLETRFQEQEEKLKVIQDKFKEDIHRHLQDFTGTVEELELHQIEMKGTMKKQKASHQKLLMGVEEAVETELNDAHRRIISVHKSARQKMLQMGQLVAECLMQGDLS
ncbi:meiosis-specific protein ASY3 isoform X2 [Mercurialis annua]|uniref:meiosis-specific protein ASY3 isoform X2 n=1 Tax=Mercurialis annua TaxID=3986 RepID=UPI00215FF62A|nr:meiosis-specific protein ASY3 isoform X2 [Mercurialis annua]